MLRFFLGRPRPLLGEGPFAALESPISGNQFHTPTTSTSGYEEYGFPHGSEERAPTLGVPAGRCSVNMNNPMDEMQHTLQPRRCTDQQRLDWINDVQDVVDRNTSLQAAHQFPVTSMTNSAFALQTMRETPRGKVPSGNSFFTPTTSNGYEEYRISQPEAATLMAGASRGSIAPLDDVALPAEHSTASPAALTDKCAELDKHNTPKQAKQQVTAQLNANAAHDGIKLTNGAPLTGENKAAYRGPRSVFAILRWHATQQPKAHGTALTGEHNPSKGILSNRRAEDGRSISKKLRTG